MAFGLPNIGERVDLGKRLETGKRLTRADEAAGRGWSAAANLPEIGDDIADFVLWPDIISRSC